MNVHRLRYELRYEFTMLLLLRDKPGWGESASLANRMAGSGRSSRSTPEGLSLATPGGTSSSRRVAMIPSPYTSVFDEFSPEFKARALFNSGPCVKLGFDC